MTSPNSFHFHSSTSLSHVDTGVVMTGGSISLILSTTLLKPLSISSSVNSYSLHWLIPPFFCYQVDITASVKNIKKALKSCSHIENYAVIVHFLAKHLKQIVAYYRIYFTQTLCIFNLDIHNPAYAFFRYSCLSCWSSIVRIRPSPIARPDYAPHSAQASAIIHYSPENP